MGAVRRAISSNPSICKFAIMGDTGDPMAAPCFCLFITRLYLKYVGFRQRLRSSRILSRNRGVRSWRFGSSSNLIRTALMSSGTGMLVNSAETSYDISFCPGGTSKLLILSTQYPLFLMWRSDLPTTGPRIYYGNTLDELYVRLPRLATIGHRGTFVLWILCRPYILWVYSDVGYIQCLRGLGIGSTLCHRRIISFSSLLNFGVRSICSTSYVMMSLSRIDIVLSQSLVFRITVDLPLSAGRIVMSVSALSSCRALNSPLVMLLAGLFAFLMHLFTSALRFWALGLTDACKQFRS